MTVNDLLGQIEKERKLYPLVGDYILQPAHRTYLLADDTDYIAVFNHELGTVTIQD